MRHRRVRVHLLIPLRDPTTMVAFVELVSCHRDKFNNKAGYGILTEVSNANEVKESRTASCFSAMPVPVSESAKRSIINAGISVTGD